MVFSRSKKGGQTAPTPARGSGVLSVVVNTPTYRSTRGNTPGIVFGSYWNSAPTPVLPLPTDLFNTGSRQEPGLSDAAPLTLLDHPELVSHNTTPPLAPPVLTSASAVFSPANAESTPSPAPAMVTAADTPTGPSSPRPTPATPPRPGLRPFSTIDPNHSSTYGSLTPPHPPPQIPPPVVLSSRGTRNNSQETLSSSPSPTLPTPSQTSESFTTTTTTFTYPTTPPNSPTLASTQLPGVGTGQDASGRSPTGRQPSNHGSGTFTIAARHDPLQLEKWGPITHPYNNSLRIISEGDMSTFVIQLPFGYAHVTRDYLLSSLAGEILLIEYKFWAHIWRLFMPYRRRRRTRDQVTPPPTVMDFPAPLDSVTDWDGMRIVAEGPSQEFWLWNDDQIRCFQVLFGTERVKFSHSLLAKTWGGRFLLYEWPYYNETILAHCWKDVVNIVKRSGETLRAWRRPSSSKTGSKSNARV